MSRASKQGIRVTLVRARAIEPAVNKVAKALADNGYQVKLLVWDRQHNLDAASGDGYSVHRFRLKAPYDRAAVFFYLPLWWIYEFFFLLKHGCEVIHACDLDTLMPAVLAKLVKRARLCYTIYDFYANNLPDGRFQPIRGLVRRLVAAVERFGIGFTEALFLVDESRYEDVRGARMKKLAYICNSPPDHLAGRPEPETRPTSGTSDMALFYAGLIHATRGLAYVVEAVQKIEGVRLIVAGTGPHRKVIEDAATRCRRIRYLGQISYARVIEKTMEADALLAFYGPGFPPSKWASSNKLFEAMMCGKPIIVSDNSSMADIVRNESCGLVVPYGNIAAIREAILRLKNDPDLRRKLGESGRRAYEQKYDWRIMEKRLLEVYRHL